MIDGGLITLPVLIGLAGLLVGGARLALWWWDRKRSQALDQWMVVFLARVKDAVRNLVRRDREIDAEPDKHGKELEDDVNKTFGG